MALKIVGAADDVLEKIEAAIRNVLPESNVQVKAGGAGEQAARTSPRPRLRTIFSGFIPVSLSQAAAGRVARRGALLPMHPTPAGASRGATDRRVPSRRRLW